jgi:PAS domain S-box-containing protein
MRNKLIVTFIVVVLAPLCLLTWFNIEYVNNAFKKNADAQLNELNKVGKQFANMWFDEQINDLYRLKKQLSDRSASEQDLLNDYVKHSDFVNQSELITVSPESSTSDDSFFTGITKDRFRDIFNDQANVIKTIFRSFEFNARQNHIIALPLLDESQQLQKILLAEVNLKSLLDNLNKINVLNSDITFDITNNSKIENTSFFDSGKPSLFSQHTLTAQGILKNANNQSVDVAISDLDFLGEQGWQLAVSKPTSVRLQATEFYQQLITFISASVLLLILCLFYWFSRKLQQLVKEKENQQRNVQKQQTALQVALQQLAEQKTALDEHAIVAVTDLKGVITYVNKKFCEISGFAENELLGQNHRIINSNTHSPAFFKKMYQTLKRNEVWSGHICNKNKSGEIYWVDTTIVPFLDERGKPQSYISIRTDMTELKLQEFELEQHKTQLQLVIDTTAVGIWDWYIETGDITFNNRWADIIGYTLHELEPCTIETWYKFAHPEDLITAEKNLKKYFNGDTDCYVSEARMKHKRGHWVWVLDAAKVVEWNKDGSPKRMIGTHLDITAYKNTEAELQSSRDQFSSLVGNIPGIIYRCKYDDMWTMLYMSKQTKEITGYKPSDFIDNKQLSFIDVIHYQDRERISDVIIQSIETNKPWSIEYRIKTQKGGISWVNEKGRAIYDVNGNVLYLDGFILDITERYNTQLKISRQQGLLESMSKQGQIGAWEIDLETQTLFWSDEVRVIHEVPSDFEPDIVTAINFYKLGEHRDKISALFENAMKTGESWHVELIIVTHQGKERWVKSIGQVEFKDGQCIRVFGSFQSIDVHKRLELESEKVNRFNKNLADLTVASEVKNSDVNEVKKLAVKSMCEVLDVARASIWIFNSNCDEMTCHNLYIKGQGLVTCDAILKAEDFPAYYEAIFDRNLVAINNVNNHPATADFVESYMTPLDIKSLLDAVIASGDGNLGILCAETVGEFRYWTQAEETYLRSLATLVGSTLVSQRRKEMSEELNVALIQAKAASVAKSQFLATMSHEIRTPMNGVLGMLELIKLEPLAKPIETKIAIAKTSAHSLLGVINDILDFSKAEAGKIELESIHFNARDLIGDVAAAQAFSAQNKGIEIILDLVALEPFQLSGDPGRIRQVLTNLLSNAIKFTEKGEVVIRAEIRRNGHDLEFKLAVKDSGIGISKEKQKQLFAAFMQVDASTTRQYGGTGLGLAISKQLCELMNGSISIKSKVGQGSEFIATMYVSEGEQQSRYIPNTHINALSILVVDDNETNRLVISEQLKHWGATVELASSANEALTYCENRVKNNHGMYDIAVLDMQMPVMDGIELCKILKAHDDFKHMPLVMMTSIAGMEGAQRYSDAGFQAYFPKPVTTADLMSALSLITNNKQNEVLPLVTSGYISSLKKENIEAPTKILLVEDNPINQQVSMLMLKKLNCEITLAENGQRAVDILSSHKHDYFKVILMDCQMPVMDGFDATIAIRNGAAGDKHKAINIIALTANVMDADKQRCIDAGMDDYLSKPIQLAILKNKLKQYL